MTFEGVYLFSCFTIYRNVYNLMQDSAVYSAQLSKVDENKVAHFDPTHNCINLCYTLDYQINVPACLLIFGYFSTRHGPYFIEKIYKFLKDYNFCIEKSIISYKKCYFLALTLNKPWGEESRRSQFGGFPWPDEQSWNENTSMSFSFCMFKTSQ